MLFRRREKQGLGEKLRGALWPRRSWLRSSRYVAHRVSRLQGTPYAIAFGFAAGVFVSFTPYIGFHLISAAVIAWAARASIIASAFGTLIGNPVTFPFIWIAAYEVGNRILGTQASSQTIDLSSGLFQRSFETLWPLIKPMTVGGVPLGLAAGAVSYVLVKRAVEAYQEKRRKDRLASEPTQSVA